MTHFHDAMGDDVYRENILDHSANPRRVGQLSDATWTHRELNPSCGDDLTFQARVEGDVLTEVRFSGTGCAVSKAAASMLAEKMNGAAVGEAEAFRTEDMLALLGVPVTSSRLRCALLGLKTLQRGIALHNERRND